MKFLFLLFAFLAAPNSRAEIPANLPVDNFLQVNGALYRSARPDEAGLRALANAGFKTIIDLEDDEEAVAAEREEANALHLNFISQPMSPFRSPDDAQVNQTLAMIQDPANFPVLVHCQHGEDRTGLIIGLYRVFAQKWTADTAYEEMLNDGFHTILFGLRDYFQSRTEGL